MIIPAPIHIPPGPNYPPVVPIPSNKFPQIPPVPIPNPPLFTRTYTAQGVQFPGVDKNNNPIYLACPVINCKDSGIISFSFWGLNFFHALSGSLFSSSLFTVDPLNAVTPFFSTVGPSNAPFLQMNLQVPGDGSSASFTMNWNPPFSVSDGQWHHYLGSFVTVSSAGTPVGALYIDDILQTPQSQVATGMGLFIAPVRGKKIYIGSGAGNYFDTAKMALSDVWIAAEQSLLDIDANNRLIPSISPGVRRIFTDVLNGNILIPNDPNPFPAASILLTGGASTFGANFGFGGTFTLINGSLSDTAGPAGVPI